MMERSSFQRNKEELELFFAIGKFINPVAVTLTMKKRAHGQRNDLITASRNVRLYLNRLNSKVLKSAAKKHGRRLPACCILEKNADDRLHHHSIISRPVHVPFEQFSATIRELWRRTDFGHRQMDVQDAADQGWISYMFKWRQKDQNLLDHIDWMNCTLTAE